MKDKERLEGCEALTLSYQGVNKAILRKPEFYQHRYCLFLDAKRSQQMIFHLPVRVYMYVRYDS